MKSLKIFLLVVPLVFLLLGCGLLFEDYLKKQDSIAKNTQTYVIGVAWDTENSNSYFQAFLKGVKLGYEQFFPNQSLMGRRVLLDIYPTPDDRDSTQNAIEHFQADSRTIAVVGHAYSSLAEKAAIAYQYHGILFVAPTATNDLALQHDFNLIFRTIRKDSEVYDELLKYAAVREWNKVAVLYESTSYGDNVYHNIMAHAQSYPGIQIVSENTYPDFLVRPLIRTFVGRLKKGSRPDVILTSDTAEYVNIFCEELGLHDLNIPILTSFAILGDAEICRDYQHIYVAEQYNPLEFTPVGEVFAKSYLKAYGETPNMHAVQGYESMLFLAEAIEKSDSFVPIEVASMLHTNSYEGVNGAYAFDENGGILHKQIHVRPLHTKGETP